MTCNTLVVLRRVETLASCFNLIERRVFLGQIIRDGVDLTGRQQTVNNAIQIRNTPFASCVGEREAER